MALTLEETVTGWRIHQMYKHDMPLDTVETQINALSQYEFLKELSEAIEQMKTHDSFK